MTKAPGFLKTASFMESMTGTTGKPFNYSDAGVTAHLIQLCFGWQIR